MRSGPTRLLIYGLNYSPELTGIGKYTGEMGPFLHRTGFDVRVVTTPPYYPEWKIAPGYRRWWYQRQEVEGVKVWRCPFYVPASPSTVKRILHLGSFALTSFFALWRHAFWRPQVVFMVEPASFSVPGGLLFSRIVGAKTWLHVQDFELDAMLGLGMLGDRQPGRALRLAFATEAWFKRRFDRVSSISNTMMDRLRERGVKEERLVFFPNWVDTELLAPGVPQRDFREEWGADEQTCVLLYSGNIGKKQGLEIVLQVAEHFERRQSDANYAFWIVGEGAAKAELVALAESMELQSVQFHPLQPYKDLPDLLRSVDLHLVIQKKGAADAVLPSKLTSILSVGGHALITAEPETELGRLPHAHPGIATVIQPEDTLMLERAVVRFFQENTEKTVNSVARSYAQECLRLEAILSRVGKEIQALCD
ncbi:MAG: WcaI family glycosyltransferase [Verrucomicrobiota bacterium]